jgi:hypothetical protein
MPLGKRNDRARFKHVKPKIEPGPPNLRRITPPTERRQDGPSQFQSTFRPARPNQCGKLRANGSRRHP